MRRAKIVATIGPATDSVEQLHALVDAGVDVVRLNMSHGEREHHVEVASRVRRVAAEAGRAVAIMADLCGPKIRTGRLEGGGPTVLTAGQTVQLVDADDESTPDAIPISYPGLAAEVSAGDRILIDDGLVELRVEATDGDRITARAVNGGPVHERKGVNLPGVKLSIPSITEKDRADLAAMLEAGVDYVALSFVRSAADCELARELIDRRDRDVRLVAKIEKPEAIDNLSAILAASDGVMVARGDLGVEVSPESVPVYQKRIIRAAIDEEKFVITATQMLQSMVSNPRPTRAEASDVANAIFDGTDAVMLSGETATGAYPIEVVRTMDRIVRFAESSVVPDRPLERRLMGVQTGSFGRALAEAAMFAAEEMKARTIVVFSEHGSMARHVSALRPVQRITALTPTECAYFQMAALWGVEPYRIASASNSDELLREGDRALLEYGIAERGETVVVVIGVIEDMPASSVIKLHHVGDLA